VGSTGTFQATVAWTGGTAALVLKNSVGSVVSTGSIGTNPKTYNATLPPGSYTLELQTTGTGSATVSNVTWPGGVPRLIIAYDAFNHAKAIDDGTYNTVETVTPSGRVLRRQVWHIATGILVEDTTFSFGDESDNPEYSLQSGVVTTYGPEGAVHIGTASSSWPMSTVNGDLLAWYDRSDVRSGVPLTDEFGVDLSTDTRDQRVPANRLGWHGKQDRFDTAPAAGILRLGARMYMPSLGRFLEKDPVPGGSCNAYDYACGDPINSSDLTGLTRCYHTQRSCLIPVRTIYAWVPAGTLGTTAFSKSRTVCSNSSFRRRCTKQQRIVVRVIYLAYRNDAYYPDKPETGFGFCLPGTKPSCRDILSGIGRVADVVGQVASCAISGAAGGAAGVAAAPFTGPLAPAAPVAGAITGCAAGVAMWDYGPPPP
jgi:RHS repeat-associated protein